MLSGVNGETALNESIFKETSSISEMLFCLADQLVIGCVCSLFVSLSDGDRAPFISDAFARYFCFNPDGYHETRVEPFLHFPYSLLRRQQQKSRTAHMTKTAIPPITPPMIAPRFEDGALGVLDVSEPVDVSEAIEEAAKEGEDAVVDRSIDRTVVDPDGDGDAVVDGSVDKTVVDPDKVDVEEVMVEVVVVLGTLGNKPMTPAVVNESVSSGHMPVVHGSLEQQPRKLPAVQTYHSLLPVQSLESRGMIDSRGSRESISNTILKYQVPCTESKGNLVKSQDTAVMLDSTSLNDWRREVSFFQ